MARFSLVDLIKQNDQNIFLPLITWYQTAVPPKSTRKTYNDGLPMWDSSIGRSDRLLKYQYWKFAASFFVTKHGQSNPNLWRILTIISVFPSAVFENLSEIWFNALGGFNRALEMNFSAAFWRLQLLCGVDNTMFETSSWCWWSKSS